MNPFKNMDLSVLSWKKVKEHKLSNEWEENGEFKVAPTCNYCTVVNKEDFYFPYRLQVDYIMVKKDGTLVMHHNAYYIIEPESLDNIKEGDVIKISDVTIIEYAQYCGKEVTDTPHIFRAVIKK